jgi:hypothetical protein
MSLTGMVPSHVDALLELLAVPADERQLPLQRVLDTGHIVELRAERGRHFLCGLLHELPISPNDPLIESLVEEPFPSEASGFLAYEPTEERLVYWSEILPAAEQGGAPLPDLQAFLRELTELSKKVSLAGAL